ncbi:DNA repair protein RAD50 [Nematocida homosporus]|uniref:DNA repair protein RAD50 n=1 Tax=Nematocida homosporus TaxID=1912981 RepID=UPI00221F507B|nr:DNA repair protein RAD50 [Nematocida homosporus]KAI5187100.1 DNA repair protein RAD50 [Nematocida homosporus]
MSGIQKLKIKGVRAFPEEHPAVIEVFSPLTLVVGRNGTGKTTIIEALKYATTGGLPPNSKSGAFVHDAQLSRESETKAQVMMKFVGCDGREYILVRGLWQKVGRQRKETKTLESALWAVEGGEKRLLCNKLSGLDSEVPMLLGTSAAVLDNVIFCHQEESTWPLGDPALVKKRMDGIFASAQFQKAVEALAALKKEKSADLKLLICRHEMLLQKKQAKKRLDLRIARTTQRIDWVMAESTTFQNRLQTLKLEQNELRQQKEEIQVRLRDKECAEAELVGLSSKQLLDLPISQLKEMAQAEEMAECIEDLTMANAKLVQERESILKGLAEQESIKHRVNQAREEAERLKEVVKQLQVEGKQEAKKEMERLQSSWLEINDILKDCIGKDLSSEEIKEWPEIDLHSAQTYSELLGLIEEQSKLRDALLKRAEDELEGQHDRIIQTLRDKTGQMGVLQEKQATIQRRLAEIDALLVQDSASSTEAFYQEIEVQQTILSTAYERKEYNKKTLLAQMARLQEETANIVQESEKRKEKEMLMAEISKKAKEKEHLLCLGGLPVQSSAESLAQIKTTTQAEVQQLKVKIDRAQTAQKEQAQAAAQKEAQELASTLIQNQKLQKIEELLGHLTSTMETSTGPISKSEVLQRIKDQKEVQLCTGYSSTLEETAKCLGGLEATAKLYSEFLERATNSCPFCKAFLNTGIAKGHLQKISTNLEQVTQRKEDLTKKLDLVRQSAETDRQQVIIKTLINAISTIGLSNRSVGISPTKPEPVAEWTALLTRLQAKLDSIIQVQKLDQEIGHLQGVASSIILHSTDPQALAEEHRQCLQRLQEIEHFEAKENQRHQEYLTKQDNARKRIRQIEETIQKRRKLTDDVHLLKKEKIDLIAKQEELGLSKTQKTSELQDLKEKEMALNRRQKELKSLYLSRQGMSTLLLIKDKIADTEDRERKLALITYTTDDQIREAELQDQNNSILAKQNQIKQRTLEVQRAIEQKSLIDNSIRAQYLKEQIAQCPVTPAHLDTQETALNYTEREIEEKQKVLSECIGELTNLQKQHQEDQKELLEYDKIEEQELSAFITIKVVNESIADIEKYVKGLQAAIVRYHADKLAEVNAIIKEIWTMTYTGGDIDSIKIVSQMDKNYALVMEKDGIEVEMRGRVSAGQKMLASIVVRLALAEAFSTNCGLLSLDEPTTNLDKANIHALANALSSIIQARKAEGTFQLLVITHDEEFVSELLRTECTEYFYRIERDNQMVPRAERVSIYDI